LAEGDARGIALIFLAAGLIMVLAALLALTSKQYRRLSEIFSDPKPAPKIKPA